MKKKITNNLLISYSARIKYHLENENFRDTNRFHFSSLYEIRKFTDKLNARRNVLEYPERAINTGEIYGMSLIQDIYQYMIEKYESQNKEVFDSCLKDIKQKYNKKSIENIFSLYVTEFPNIEIFNKFISPKSYVKSISKIKSKKIEIIKEIAQVFLYNTNPAFSKYHEFFNDNKLACQSDYQKIFNEIYTFSIIKKPLGH